MIMAITSFKPNSTNANFSNQRYRVSQPNFKGAVEEYSGYFNRVLAEYTEPAAIERTFVRYVGEVALESEKAARAFVARFRDKVPGLAEERIEKSLQEGLDFVLERMAPIS